ncbi:hypothetical protein R4Y45_06355 [Holzapfeliella sp. He02]|uniref:Uncharacterized protein n=1 Tax=Holzapfeliella saturejae TaxID=3082953 RepID=A0ABU8SHI7_9LACO
MTRFFCLNSLILVGITFLFAKPLSLFNLGILLIIFWGLFEEFKLYKQAENSKFYRWNFLIIGGLALLVVIDHFVPLSKNGGLQSVGFVWAIISNYIFLRCSTEYNHWLTFKSQYLLALLINLVSATAIVEVLTLQFDTVTLINSVTAFAFSIVVMFDLFKSRSQAEKSFIKITTCLSGILFVIALILSLMISSLWFYLYDGWLVVLLILLITKKSPKSQRG